MIGCCSSFGVTDGGHVWTGHCAEVQHSEVLSVCVPGVLSVAGVPPAQVQCGGFDPQQTSASPLVIPGFPPIPPGDLPPSQLGDTGHPGTQYFLLNEVKQLWRAAGLLVNSVGELERATIEGLQRYINENSPSNKVSPRLASFSRMVQLLH
jgi:hypothetical protein